MVIPVAATPLIITAAFETLPKVWLKRKERELAQKGLSATGETSTYFRVSPYGDSKEDQKIFDRADNAHERVLEWIKTTSETIVYITGRSGTGKTSLLAAHTVPNLRSSAKFFPVVLRSFTDPNKELRRILLKAGASSKQLSANDSDSVLELLKKVAKKVGRRIVLVFDQFEEILVSGTQDSTSIRALLKELQAGSAGDPLVVISIRSDYLAILEEMSLPKLQQSLNWMDIGAFTEQASHDFLNRSGLIISPELMEDVVSQAREIEDSRGMIRPITLNMIGLALSSAANASERDVVTRRGLNKLILDYVVDSLNTSEIRPFAAKIVRQMFTKGGLKVPISIDDLATKTGFPARTVANSLLMLSTRGLTRRVDMDHSVWEISHDFVARLFQEALSTWKAEWKRLLVASLVPALLLTWLLVLLVLVPGWQDRKLRVTPGNADTRSSIL